MSRRQGLHGTPKRHDIVVGLAPRRYFHQLDASRAPLALRFDPGARPPLVLRVEVLEIALLPGPLHQSEAGRRLRGKGGYLQLDRIRELPKYMLTGFRLDHQAVGIMHFRPIVIEAPAVGLIEEKHRREWCNADDAHFGAREQRKVPIHQRLDSGLHGEPVGARGRFAFEQRVNDDGVRTRTRPLDPEVREYREFLSGGFRRVDGEPPRRQAVEQILGDGAEVACALEYQEFIPDFLGVHLAAEAETRYRKGN